MRYILCFIARIIKQKGFEQYLDTIHAINTKYPNAIFHCANCTLEYEEEINNVRLEI